MTDIGVIQGILAALTFSTALFLLYIWPKRAWLIASCMLVIVTPLALGGFWFSDGPLGISDWDYYFSYHHFLRQSILEHHTFPLWNPYTCGGTAALADPEFPVMTVTFPLELLFGVEKGFRLAIYLSVITGGLGMLALSRRLKLSVWAALAAAIGFCFGSVNLLEIIEGHQNIFAAMWIPWILFSWYSAYQEKPIWRNKYIILCGIFLALTFYAGGIYLLMYTAITLLGLIIVTKNHTKALQISLLAGGLALGLAAFKLIPVFLWLSQFQDQVYASSAFTLTSIHKILLGRYMHGAEDIIQGQGGGWHEYGAYLGPVIIALAIIGMTKLKTNRLVRLLTISTLLAILISSAGPYLKPLFDQASFLPRSNIARFILFAVIPLCLLAGIGLDRLKDLSSRIRLPLIHILLILIAFDLMTLSYPLSQQAFVVPRNEQPVPAAPLPIAYSAFDYKTRVNGVDYTRAYEATIAGYGSLSYCAVLGPSPAVRTIHDEVDKEILSVKTSTNKEGSFNLLAWNPNRVIARVSLPEDGNVILNANYAKGWFVNNVPAKEISGRVGAEVSAGTHEVTWQYRTPGFASGSLISSLTIIVLITTWIISIQKTKH